MALKESGNASFFGSEKYKEAMLRKYGVDNPDFIPGKQNKQLKQKERSMDKIWKKQQKR